MSQPRAWPLFSDLFHLGYVTEHLEDTRSRFAERTGVDDFVVTKDLSVEVQRRGKPVVLRFDLALAWADETMVELIEPRDEGDGFYREPLEQTGSRSTVFHHIGVEVPSGNKPWNQLETSLQDRGIRFEVYGEFGDRSTFAYADFSDTLGHFVEFVSYTEKGREFLDDIPRNEATELPV